MKGHDSPHREQSKVDAIVPQLQFDYGYVVDGGPLQIACFPVGADTSSGSIHATMVPDSKNSCPHGDREGVVQLLLDKECRPEGQDWQILRQVSPTQSHQGNGAAEKAVSIVRALDKTKLADIEDQVLSFTATTHSPMLPWTIRHTAWILTRCTVRRDTRMTPYETFVDRNTEKRFFHWRNKSSLAVLERLSISLCTHR